jgi:signal transduction histidine kinase
MAINWITLQTPAPDEAPLQQKLNDALVRELLSRTRSAAIALLGTVWLLWMIVGPSTGRGVAALFLALIGFAAIRLAGAIWLERQARERIHHMRAFAWFAAMSTLVGLTLGAIVLASYPQITPLGVALCSVAMIGINSGALVSLAPSPLVYLLYVGANISAVTYFAFAHPLPGQEHVFQVLQLVYSSALIVLLRNVHRSFRANIIVRLRLATSLEQLRHTQAELVEASRQAGRADVATELLHSVGNVLNSVNVSATLVSDIVGRSKTNNLSKVVAILLQHRDHLGPFLRDDPRGQKLPEYFTELAKVVERDNTAVKSELESLTRHVDHIKVLVASQHSQVKPSDVVETFDVHVLLDDAVRLSAASNHHHAVEVVRRFDNLPPATLDRHKALQILIILLANARDAVMSQPMGERRITLHARRGPSGDLEIAIEDNGCGIDPNNLERIFGLGFTTKPRGRGLGLHYGACAARELRGNLTAHSAGIGTGASFLLALPFAEASAA